MVQLTFCASGFVSTSASPPAAETRNSPVAGSFVANTIVSPGPQLAPRGPPLMLQIVAAGPPFIVTFLNKSGSSKNPTQFPSGDMKGPSGETPRTWSGCDLRSIVFVLPGAIQ